MVHEGECPQILIHLWIEMSVQRTVNVILIPPPSRNILNRGRSKSWTIVHKGLWGKRLGKLRKVSFVKAAARLDFRNWSFPRLTIHWLTAECRPVLLSVLLTKAYLFANEFCVDFNASKQSGLFFKLSIYR